MKVGMQMDKEKGLAATSPVNEGKLHQNHNTKMPESQITIIHVMADGRVLDSIVGYVVPVNNRTIAAYRLLANQALEGR